MLSSIFIILTAYLYCFPNRMDSFFFRTEILFHSTLYSYCLAKGLPQSRKSNNVKGMGQWGDGDMEEWMDGWMEGRIVGMINDKVRKESSEVFNKPEFPQSDVKLIMNVFFSLRCLHSAKQLHFYSSVLVTISKTQVIDTIVKKYSLSFNYPVLLNKLSQT